VRRFRIQPPAVQSAAPTTTPPTRKHRLPPSFRADFRSFKWVRICFQVLDLSIYEHIFFYACFANFQIYTSLLQHLYELFCGFSIDKIYYYSNGYTYTQQYFSLYLSLLRDHSVLTWNNKYCSMYYIMIHIDICVCYSCNKKFHISSAANIMFRKK